jgi:GTP-binding protein
MFVDRVKIEAIAGRGGHGCMSFRREKYVPRGGPNGGDGGHGGSIIIVAEKGVNSLVDYAHRHHIRGDNGNNGQGYGCHGSAARPEIANYPFTTKYPNLGQVRLDLDRSFIMADIPGLIEGAAVGVGLGHDFLKHIERAGVLVHLVEPMPMDQSDPVANYHAIRNELIQFNPALGKRPEMIVVSKSELPGAQEVAAQLKSDTGQEVHIISAATGAGLPPLLNAIDKMLTAHRNAAELAAAESDTSDAS